MTHIEIAHAVNKAVQTGDVASVSSLVKENYIQHTPVVADGRKGLETLVAKIRNKEIPAPKITNIRTFIDGAFVVLHHDVLWPNRKAMFEIFRFEDNLAAEHWSAIMDHPDKTANGHSMVDGSVAITDRMHIQQNKTVVRNFVETVLIGGRFDRILEFYHADIIQHNPFIPDGVNGLVNGIKELANRGLTIRLERIKMILGEGNFVLACSEGLFAGKPSAFFDLFRVEGNKVVEHWDVLQEIPTAEKQAHTNGFF